jgi:hypothetical protein
LAEVVQALSRHSGDISNLIDDPPKPRTSYAEKNKINRMTDEYAKEQRKRYLKEAAKIKDFIASPENTEILRMYESIVEEFQLKITSKRKNHQNFDEVMEYLIDMLFNRDPILRQTGNKRLTRAVIFYMYWNCDIGAT